MKRAAALAALCLAACSGEAPAPTFHASGNPERLSDWGVMAVHDGVLDLAPRVQPYDLASPLFSDYALKLRTVTLPEGTPATYQPEGPFDFPVGTIVSKTFYFPMATDEWSGDVADYAPRIVADGVMPLDGLRLVETRILARREDGWIALPYIWNDAQTDAVLKRTGAVVPLTLHRKDGRAEAMAYLVPNTNQCAGCHATNNTTRVLHPIGLRARHLNKASAFAAGFNQLDDWRLKGLLDGDFTGAGTAPKNAAWDNESASLEARARAYLDINCSHCHSDVGPADTSGLDLSLETAGGPALGLCKATIAAGAGSGGRPFDIVPGEPDQSILLYRVETTAPGAMMPELGRSVTHEEGAALIRDWIAAMDGACG